MRIDQIITKLADIARLEAKLERLAIEIAHKCNDDILAKSPNGLAAIFLGVSLLQIVDLPNMAGVTEVTVRSRCNDILTGFKLTITVQPL